MRIGSRTVATLVVIGTLCATPVLRAQHIADSAVLESALTRQRAVDAANRAAVERVLTRPDARAVAQRLGLELSQAQVKLAQMTSAELRELAEPARAIETELSGGADTIVISVTTLLLIVIIVLLLVN